MSLRVLLTEKIDESADQVYESAGFEVTRLDRALERDDYVEVTDNYDLIGVRSRSELDASFFRPKMRLKAVGVYGIGTNHIDLDSAAKAGVAVFNAPYSNTRSVVELVVAQMINLARRVGDRNAQMHAGMWQKSAAGCVELRRKTLGIVGYGNIGSQLSVVAEHLGMQVVYHDLRDTQAIGNAVACTDLKDLLRQADFVSLHVDGRSENTALLDATMVAEMKLGAYLINMSRGHVVDIQAVADALKRGDLSGAAFDVFPVEPGTNGQGFESPLQNLPNVMLTPHIGAGTEEAQLAIASYVSRKLVNYWQKGTTSGSVNLPEVRLGDHDRSLRLLHIHSNIPGRLQAINSLLAAKGLNVVGQALQTKDVLGVVLVDIESQKSALKLVDFESIEGTLAARLLSK